MVTVVRWEEPSWGRRRLPWREADLEGQREEVQGASQEAGGPRTEVKVVGSEGEEWRRLKDSPEDFLKPCGHKVTIFMHFLPTPETHVPVVHKVFPTVVKI